MAFFKAKIGDTVYELDKLTLGDGQILKHTFNIPDLSEVGAMDPDVLVGMLAICIRRADPSKTLDQATVEAQAIGYDDIVQGDDEKEPAEAADAPLEQPATVDASVATVSPETPGSSETAPETPGTPVTPTS